jgi:hypothetical protein
VRKGFAVKAAISTVLEKSWAAAAHGLKLTDLDVRFSGTGASVIKTQFYNGIRAVINLPDFKDDVGYSDVVVNRFVAMALHELGHVWFTDDEAWDVPLILNSAAGIKPALLHKCINAFEDVREERAVIDSGYAVGSATLFPVLIAHMIKGCTVESFKLIENVPFSICVDGRGYGSSVAGLIDPRYKSIFDEGVARCAGQRSTADAAANGVWLWKALQQEQDRQEQEQKQEQEQQDAGDDAGDDADDADDAGKVHSVEPEAFNDIPMSAASSIPELGTILNGAEKFAIDGVALQPLPALGRLSYELRQVLENSATDDLSRHLSAGRLSRNWSAIARGSSDVFERRNTVAGIDTAVLIAVDQSGSMGLDPGARNPFDAISAAAGAARMLAQVLSRCPGVAFDVRGFSSGDDFMGQDQCEVGAAPVDAEVRRLQNQAGWLVFKSFAESAGAFTRRSAALYETRSTTPEIAALADVLRLISARREQRKIVIWIGDGDGYSADAVKALQAKYPGVTVIGVGIKVDLSKCFKHSVRVNEAKDLAAVSFRTVIKAIAA